jgi:hypothetical protein
MRDVLTVVVGLGVIVATVWLFRRFAPVARCPSCGSEDWIFLGDAKECSRCGRSFV